MTCADFRQVIFLFCAVLLLKHVDPRFTRMSAVCDVYVGIRSGSDIAFLGGVVNYVLTNTLGTRSSE